jgi:hypothetical protein
MYDKGDLIGRAANKLKREVLRLPGFRVLRGYAHREALEAHSTRLPPLDPRDLPILEALRKTGATIVDVEGLGLPESPAMFAALGTLVDELRAMPTGTDNAPRIMPKRLMDFPEIYLWGLSERLLDLIENYIGLPIRYEGVDVRREVADGRPTDVRQFHIDTLVAVKALHYVSGFVPDAKMEGLVPKSRWVQATAKARSGAFADTCRVFHKAQPPRDTDRYSITISWTSTTPVKTYPSHPLSDEADAFVRSRINARQLAVLPARAG